MGAYLGKAIWRSCRRRGSEDLSRECAAAPAVKMMASLGEFALAVMMLFSSVVVHYEPYAELPVGTRIQARQRTKGGGIALHTFLQRNSMLLQSLLADLPY